MPVPAKTPRLVQLLARGLRFRIETTEPVVYLTFDDGPIPELTPWILDQLEVVNARATFFLVGQNAERNPGLVLKILEKGHRIGNHTQHHRNGFKTKLADYVADVEHCQQILQPYLNPDQLSLFRPPYGRILPRQVSKVKKAGFQIYMWDVLSKDYDTSLSPGLVEKNVLENVKPGSIVVLHDNVKAEKNLKTALPRILSELKRRGYRFEVLP